MAEEEEEEAAAAANLQLLPTVRLPSSTTSKWSSNTLIGQFADPTAALPFSDLASHIRSEWGGTLNNPSIEPFLLSPNLFAFHFSSHRRLRFILSRSPHLLPSNTSSNPVPLLLLQTYSPSCVVTTCSPLITRRIATVPIWAHLFYLPIAFWDDGTLRQITAPAGRLVMSGRVDYDRTSVKALLEIDVENPLLPGCYVEFDQRRVFVLLGYEHNPRACARCNGGGFEFKFDLCPSDFIEMRENAVMCGYEDDGGGVSFAPLLDMEEAVGQLAGRLPRSEMTATALEAEEHEADKEEYLREVEKVDDGLMDESAWPDPRGRLDFTAPYLGYRGPLYNRYQAAVQRHQVAAAATVEEEEEEMSAVHESIMLGPKLVRF